VLDRMGYKPKVKDSKGDVKQLGQATA
jgi:hypothetical protein